MPRLKKDSAKKTVRRRIDISYPLQSTSVDLPLDTVLAWSASKRRRYIVDVLTQLKKLVKTDKMTLKRHISFKAEMRDLRKVLYSPIDQYLYTDDLQKKRWVLGVGSPGSTHINWSRHNIWKMKTKGGYLLEDIRTTDPALIKKLEHLLDLKRTSKEGFRSHSKTAVQNILSYIQFNNRSGCAFPPFHARFLVERYTPQSDPAIVFDPCAGWGGRLIGTLLVQRPFLIQYIGVDPEERNRAAYEGLTRRATVYLKNELSSSRSAEIHYMPFEDFITTSRAEELRGTVDFAMTSPPYFGAENYNPSNKKQSANRYVDYQAWRDKFYRVLLKGVFDLLKEDAYFALNIADVAEAKTLEKDARLLAKEAGFVTGDFYKLAMPLDPAVLNKRSSARHIVRVNGTPFKYEPVFVFYKPKYDDPVLFNYKR